MSPLPIYESHQDMLRRTVLGSIGALLYSTLIFAAFTFGYLTVDGLMLAAVVTTFWVGHLTMVALLLSGKTQSLHDPSLTLPQMAWAILFVSILLYVAAEMRSALMLAYLCILPFGAFRLQWQGFLGITLFTLACYTLTLFALQQSQPGQWAIELEVVFGFSFFVAMLGFSVMGREFSRLRERLSVQNMELQRALNRIEELAVTDDLTGLFNRRYLMKMIEQQRALANREGSPFVLAFVDLDHFKQINDDHGHHTGDQVLKQFALILQESVREVDVIARYGGEEFVVLLTGVELNTAKQVVERIRTLVERMRFSDRQLPMTASIGLTQYNAAESASSLIKRADLLLYQAKRNGRNRVELIEVSQSADEIKIND